MVRLRIMGREAPARTRVTPLPGRFTVPVMRSGSYTDGHWEAESYAIFAEGGNPGPCPDCGRTGFYGPRFTDPDVKCRACRFCGFFQTVGGAVERHRPTVHGCAAWPSVSRAPYLWWVSPDATSYACPYCGDPVDVSAATVAAPATDIDHPWWRVPQYRTQTFYKGLWSHWECSAGRTLL